MVYHQQMRMHAKTHAGMGLDDLQPFLYMTTLAACLCHTLSSPLLLVMLRKIGLNGKWAPCTWSPACMHMHVAFHLSGLL